MPSAYLSKTFGTAATSTKIGTFSWWMKRSGVLSGEHDIIASPNGGEGGGNRAFIRIDNNNQVDFRLNNSSNTNIPTMLFRDVNAWYHCVLTINLNESAGADRLKFYVNGDLVTSYSSENYPGGSLNIKWGQNGIVTTIGYDTTDGGGGHFDGQMAHVHWIDGTAYGPTTFGETDATTGIWKPKTSPSVNYGNNGFFLKFDNAANMGLDSSGQGNNFTTTGTIVQAKDTPSNVFACLNRLDFDSSNTTLTNINNTLTGGNQGVAYNTVRATMGATKGKWYWEVKAADNAEIDQIGVSEMKGLSVIGNTGGFTSSINAYGAQLSNGYKVGLGQSGAAYMGGFSANDIMMLALDLDNDKLTIGRNGQWADGSGNANQTYANSTAAFTGLTSDLGYMPTHCMRDSAGNNSGTSHYNFGNGYFGTTAVSSAQNPDDGIGVFEYAPPTGFRAWCTKSINAEEYS